MKRYKMKNPSKSFLERHGFSYNYEFSSKEETYYSLSIPVCKWLEYTTLRAEIRVIQETREVTIDVYDGYKRTKYAPFYYVPCGDYTPILDEIWKVINKKLEELNIYEVKRNVQRRSNKNQVHPQRKRGEGRTYNKNRSRRLDRPKSSRGRKPEDGGV